METIDPRHLLVKIAKILERLKIPYLVTGGMAVLIWGRPRFTADIDIVIEFKAKDINGLVASLSKLGEASYIDRNMIEDALTRKGEFNFIHGDTGIKVDFWILDKSDAFEIDRLKRRIGKNLLGQQVYFISPEDLILSKLRWHKQSGGSTRHLEDIESVIKISGKKLDMEYLEKMARKQGDWKYYKLKINRLTN